MHRFCIAACFISGMIVAQGALAVPPAPLEPADASTCAAAHRVVTFETKDGVMLEADLHATGKPNGPVAILLHMIPPHHDRSNYPQAFVDALLRKGVSVLNVDRRGAGQSKGHPKAAYSGPKGKLDAQAARDFLHAHPCRFDTTSMIIVGASNGTTTTLDYTLAAHQEDSPYEVPKGLVFLTGGKYTENQNAIKDHRATLDKLPILFVFSKEERAWSVGFQADASSQWLFKEYAEGAHGTKMFGVRPEAIEVVATWIAAQL